MKLRVLGCSGGIGQDRRTTSLLVDDEILIDSGSGVGDMSLDEMARVRHVFLTHSHLDHIAFLPLMVDSIFERIKTPIMVHGQAATLKALRDHIFNWAIWPDFAKLPTPENPVMSYHELEAGDTFQVNGKTLELIPVNHIIPTVGYRVESSAGKSFAFTGDTTTNDSFWDALNRHSGLDLLIVEAAFSNKDEELSDKARHYCSKTLAADIVKLKHSPQLWLTHHKPGEEAAIFNELRAALPNTVFRQLKSGDTFTL